MPRHRGDTFWLMEALPDAEIEIGKRLRAFRESTKIPRTAFAISIGIGPERLASYEAARVRLRYGVFKSIAEQYRLNPFWLATGQGLPMLDQAFDFDAVRNGDPRSPFSQVYQQVLDPLCRDMGRILGREVATMLNSICRCIDILKNDSAPPISPAVLGKIQQLIGNLVKVNNRVVENWKNKSKL